MMGDQAVGFQQVADQRLFNDFFASGIVQVIGAEFVALNGDVLIVDAGAVEVGNWLAFQLIQTIKGYGHFPLCTCAQIAF
ncbi:hypothetical protein D3C76_1712880 [compost metagenome]